MTALADFAARIAQMFADANYTTFTTDDVDEGLRQALDGYSRARPVRAVESLTLAASGREVDISTSLTGVVTIERVWLPYTADKHPPTAPPFEHWVDEQILYFPGSYQPQAGDVARIFYTTRHTIDDLDGATETTVRAEDETLLCIGGAAYAVLARSRATTEEVTLADQVPTSGQVMAWAKARLAEFKAGLEDVRKAQSAQSSSRVTQGPLDRWDGISPRSGQKWG